MKRRRGKGCGIGSDYRPKSVPRFCAVLMLSGTAEESRARPLGMQSRKASIWRILPVAPTLDFSPLPPVQSAHLERVLWVDLTRSPGARRVTAPCAKRTAESTRSGIPEPHDDSLSAHRSA